MITSFHAAPVVRATMMLAGFAAAIGFGVGLSFWSIAYLAVVAFLCTLLDELPKCFARTDNTQPSATPGLTYQPGSWAESNTATPSCE